jgi:hypothetical protein
VARGLCHDCRSLTPGGLLLGALSLGDTQDCIIGGFRHGGALALRAPRMGQRSFAIIQQGICDYPSGLWRASKYVPPKELRTSVLGRCLQLTKTFPVFFFSIIANKRPIIVFW